MRVELLGDICELDAFLPKNLPQRRVTIDHSWICRILQFFPLDILPDGCDNSWSRVHFNSNQFGKALRELESLRTVAHLQLDFHIELFIPLALDLKALNLVTCSGTIPNDSVVIGIQRGIQVDSDFLEKGRELWESILPLLALLRKTSSGRLRVPTRFIQQASHNSQIPGWTIQGPAARQILGCIVWLVVVSIKDVHPKRALNSRRISM